MDIDNVDIFSAEFLETAKAAVREAREQALAAGHPVVYRDSEGRYVEEWPDGRIFEVRFHPGAPPESHCTVVRELTDLSA